MGKQSRKKRTVKLSSTAKGRIVEQIAAWMYCFPGTIVAKNVHYPIPGGERTREIDVLLIRHIVGYPTHVAIECKNERSVIGIEKIDAFIGKLQDLQLPLEQSIYISASGYTQGALERARAVGIQTLTLKGLTQAGLIESAMQAFRATVYLLLQVMQWPQITLPCIDNNPLRMFCDNGGYPIGSLLDLILEQWEQGFPPSFLGDYEMEVLIPPGWYHLVQGKLTYTQSMSVHVHIHGLVTSSQGEAREYQLKNDWDGKIDRDQVHLSFQPDLFIVPVTSITEEAQLQEIIHTSGAKAILTHRYRLPRILVAELFLWPVSIQTAEKLLTNLLAHEQEKPLPHILHFADFEEKDMAGVFDPIWEGQQLNVDVEQVDALLVQAEERMRYSIQKNLKDRSVHSCRAWCHPRTTTDQMGKKS